MALPATAVIEVRSTGSDSACGGGFNAARGGTDYTVQDAAQATGTVSSTTTTVTATTGIFTAAMVGNYITDGSIWREITAFTSSTVVTIDSNAGSGWSGTTIYVGGGFASIGRAGSVFVAGNTIQLKKASYSITSATNNVPNGCLSMAAQSAGANTGKLIGYNATRGDNPNGTNRPTLTASGIATFVIINVGIGNHVENLIVDGASLTSSRGMYNTGGTIYNCKGQNCTNSAFSVGFLLSCEATGCSSIQAIVGSPTSSAWYCWSHDNTVTGFGYIPSYFCISSNNSGASSRGFDDAFTSLQTCFHCTAYNNGSDGFKWNTGAGNAANAAYNCVAYGNAGYGFNISSAQDMYYLYNCAAGSNTSGATNNFTAANKIGFVTLTADPFTNKASNDYSLNNTAGGGASCRNAAIGNAFPSGFSLGYGDIGALRHQDPAGGGGGGMMLPAVLQGGYAA